MPEYDPKTTALLVVDPFNDFLAPEGKLWPAVRETAEEADLLNHLRQIIDVCRQKGMTVFFVPHHRSEPNDIKKWRHPNPSQAMASELQVFARGQWGGEFHQDFQPREGDVIAQEHWGQSGFANTDLDMLLKQNGVEKIILIGMLANTCIGATARFGMELGYHVTLVTDATAAWDKASMHAAHEVDGPRFAHAIFNTKGLLAAL